MKKKESESDENQKPEKEKPAKKPKAVKEKAEGPAAKAAPKKAAAKAAPKAKEQQEVKAQEVKTSGRGKNAKSEIKAEAPVPTPKPKAKQAAASTQSSPKAPKPKKQAESNIPKAGCRGPKRETKTTLVKAEEHQQQWYLFDAKGKTLGRLATEIVRVLIGKHKPSYTPNLDMGDGVIVVNADAVKVTGLKEARKVYRYYTGYIGGQREYIYRDIKVKKPTYILWHAVKGMMPKSRLGKQQLRKLRLFTEGEHPHQAQKPIKVEI